jgi:hypothetical protein
MANALHLKKVMGMNQKTKAKRKTEKVEQKQKLHKFTQDYPSERKDYKPVQGDPLNNGKVSIEDAERIESADLPDAA